MLNSNPYYHAIIRKAIVAFGKTFTGMQCRHYDDNGAVAKIVQVPIAYAPKEKWFTRLSEDPDFAQKFQIELPRMSFEIIGMQYDAERKIGKYKDYMFSNCPGQTGKIYSPVPWNVTISLSTYTKTQDDSLQILEQILPFFGPALIINIDLIDRNITQDIPVVLRSVERSDTYGGSLEDSRMIIQEFVFEMKLNLFGPIDNRYAVIKETIVDINTKNDINSTPLETYDAQVVPREAEKDDIFTIHEDWI